MPKECDSCNLGALEIAPTIHLSWHTNVDVGQVYYMLQGTANQPQEQYVRKKTSQG